MAWDIYFSGLTLMLAFAATGWIASVIRNNVTLVDSMWSLFFLIAIAAYGHSMQLDSLRYQLLLGMVTIWSLRLSIYLTWRNWGPHEDHRYQAIRHNNEPHFWLKSLYIVFGFQALLAWIISLPLFAATQSHADFNWLDIAGCTLWLFGFIWESLADWQLTRFKANPANKGMVMSQGLWALSRHPNYFGECCLWWGYYLIALAAGGWWAIPAPILMTFLLLKISGVALLEKDISERRPAYAEYIANTSAFFPRINFRKKS